MGHTKHSIMWLDLTLIKSQIARSLVISFILWRLIAPYCETIIGECEFNWVTLTVPSIVWRIKQCGPENQSMRKNNINKYSSRRWNFLAFCSLVIKYLWKRIRNCHVFTSFLQFLCQLHRLVAVYRSWSRD